MSKALARGRPAPPLDGDLESPFAFINLDPSSAAPWIDVGFEKPFVQMLPGEVEVVMRDLQALVQGALGAHKCYSYFPAPGCPTGFTARVIRPPEIFVGLIPPEERTAWAEAWSQGDPVQRACQDDLYPPSSVVE